MLMRCFMSNTQAVHNLYAEHPCIDDRQGRVQEKNKATQRGTAQHIQSSVCPKCAQAYQDGIRRCMGSIPLWRSSARLEEKAGAVGKARAILEQARLKNPHQDELWLAAVRTEQRATNTKAADALMAKALQV